MEIRNYKKQAKAAACPLQGYGNLFILFLLSFLLHPKK
jgi:hypothetical protein